MNQKLENKVVVITGGAGVIGSGISEHLIKRGAKVAILDIDEGAAKELADSLNRKGKRAEGIKADVLDTGSLEEAAEKVRRVFGPCQILINGAGGNHPKGTTDKEHFYSEDLERDTVSTFFDLDPEGIRFVFDLNFMGTLLATRVFGKDMLDGTGRIINISSMNAFTPLTKIPAYSGAKAAVSNFTQWLAVHFSKVPIRVNAIAPGFFLTEQNRSLLLRDDGELTERGKTILDHTPLQRFGDPEDLYSTLDWLTDERSGFVTGVVVPVDGGFSAFSGV